MQVQELIGVPSPEEGPQRELDDGQEISIPAPDGDTVLEIEESRSSRRTLELLCGDGAGPTRSIDVSP